jgi:peroxiredoxin
MAAMSVALLAARLLLAAVFAVAGLGKLARREQTKATLGKFGVAPGSRPGLAIALPLGELAVAVGLVATATAPWAGLAALLLLSAFTIGVLRVLRGGEEVDCNCFGSLAPSRISRWTLARNLALMALVGFVFAAGLSDAGASATGWVGGLGATALVGILAGLALLAAAINFAFSWQLMKQNGRLVAQLESASGGAAAPSGPKGLAPGTPAPAFALPDLAGRTVALDDLLDTGRGLVLLFSDPGCSACEPLFPRIGPMQREDAGDPLPVVISLGEVAANQTKAEAHGLQLVLLAEDFELARSFGVNGMPGAVLVDRDGLIAGDPAVGAIAVQALLDEVSSPLRLIKVGA